jgi:SAM-dependent methyltransferase
MSHFVDLYTSAYRHFAKSVLEQVRREAFGEDIGQNSWLTVDEYLRFFKWLGLKPAEHVLEVGCGSGGPALFMARTTGCRVTGIDINEHGIANAKSLAQEQGLEAQVYFHQADARQRLPFEDETFDAALCIDTINHLPDRLHLLRQWHRVLRPGGRALFTDPVIVTGLLSNEELLIRSSIGYYLFAPPGENERLITEAGFELIRSEDITENEAQIAKRRYEARARHREALIQLEGQETFEAQQEFLAIAHKLSNERRLSRFVFVARKARQLAYHLKRKRE